MDTSVMEELLLPGAGSTTLSLNVQLPIREHDGPGVPVMLTCDPYRKDDLGTSPTGALADYLVAHGYGAARLDVRGTGRSRGTPPSAEYAPEEVGDLCAAIEHLAVQPWCSGAVGLWGISWSANNALLAATLDPPALRTCVVVHPCDDLFMRDIHLIDGMLHLDRYHVFIDLVNAVTRSPEYPTDDGSLLERFDREPWMLGWLQHPERDTFWTARSLSGRYDQVKVPVLAVAGWYDGYRDCTFELLKQLEVPVQAVVGPWSHVLPDDGGPGPALDWFPLLLDWLDRWMPVTSHVPSPPTRRVLLYRQGRHLQGAPGTTPAVDHPGDAGAGSPNGQARGARDPEVRAEEESGAWYELDAWPPRGRTTRTLGLNLGSLSWLPAGTGIPAQHAHGQPMTIDSVPWTGTEAGHWWGDATGEQCGEGATAFDSEPLLREVEILGAPVFHLGTGASGARLFARLVDVSHDGRARLVSGGGVDLAGERGTGDGITPSGRLRLRTTSWTFAPGHRIRLLLSTALWPLAWPTSRRVPTTFDLTQARVDLPIVDPGTWEHAWAPEEHPAGATSPGVTPQGLSPTVAETTAPWMVTVGADGATLAWGPPGSARRTALRSGTLPVTTTPSLEWGLAYSVRTQDDRTEADAHGASTFVVRDHAGRVLQWGARLSLSSSAGQLSYAFERTLHCDGVALRRRRWAQTLPGDEP